MWLRLICLQRLDGRATYDFRKVRIAFGNELGHVEVQLGQTRVLCQVTCSVARPFPDRPAEGFIQFNTGVRVTGIL